MEITVDTKLVVLLGKPLRQSFSSKMHSEAYRLQNLNYIRIPVEVDKEHLGNVVNGLRHMNVVGISVTKPYKVEIVKYLDELDELAEKMGSVNCILNSNGRLKGYNTDGEGFIRALANKGSYKMNETTFFCFGAGGTGRAICSTLSYKGAKKIYIVDKIDNLSKSLANNINSSFAPVAEQIMFDDVKQIREKLSKADIVMNLSGIGMYPHLDKTPIEKEALKLNQLVFDATYNPEKTRFLQEAELIGCETMNGKNMLINGVMLWFELYTGINQTIKFWMEIMEKIIGGQQQ